VWLKKKVAKAADEMKPNGKRKAPPEGGGSGIWGRDGKKVKKPTVPRKERDLDRGKEKLRITRKKRGASKPRGKRGGTHTTKKKEKIVKSSASAER